jgi:hypothetical protein
MLSIIKSKQQNAIKILFSAEHRMALKAEFPRMFRFFPMKGVQYAFCGATCSSTTTQVQPFATQQQIKNNTSMANP